MHLAKPTNTSIRVCDVFSNKWSAGVWISLLRKLGVNSEVKLHVETSQTTLAHENVLFPVILARHQKALLRSLASLCLRRPARPHLSAGVTAQLSGLLSPPWGCGLFQIQSQLALFSLFCISDSLEHQEMRARRDYCQIACFRDIVAKSPLILQYSWILYSSDHSNGYSRFSGKLGGKWTDSEELRIPPKFYNIRQFCIFVGKGQHSF